MAVAERKLTREQEAALTRWREQVARVAAAGDVFADELRALGRTWSELDAEHGADRLGLGHAESMPGRLLYQFCGEDTTRIEVAGIVPHHNPGAWELTRASWRERGWLPAPEGDHAG